MTDLLCPVCESGKLTVRTHVGQFSYKGQNLSVPGLEYCECDSCGADPVMANQAKRNQVKIADAKRASDKLLCSQEIVEIRRNLGLTQHAASAVFGGGLNAFSKYERGEVLQSEAMDRLLRVASGFPEVWGFLRNLHASQAEYFLSIGTEAPVKLVESDSSFSFVPSPQAMTGRFEVLKESNDWIDQGKLRSVN